MGLVGIIKVWNREKLRVLQKRTVEKDLAVNDEADVHMRSRSLLGENVGCC